MEKVLIITPGGFPVPSVKGGAVQNLVEHIVKENEKHNAINLFVATPIDDKAKKYAELNYSKTKFVWVKIPKIISFFDNCIYKFLSKLLKNKKTISFRNNLKMMLYSLYLAKYIKNNKFDKIVIENNIRLFWIIKLFKNRKRYQGKYYFHLHNIPRGTLGCKREIKETEKFLCISDFLINNICGEKSKITKIAKERTILLKNCIDLSVFNNDKKYNEIDDIKKKYNILDKDNVLLFVGRISSEKGILELIKAFNSIKCDNIKLIIVGATFYNSKIKSNFETEIYNLASSNSNIIFTGYIDYSKIKLLYHIADIAILPSMWEEPAGLTMIEAIASGTPVISTNSGGIPEYLHDDCAILLDRDKNIIENIKKSIIELLSENKKRENYIKKGLEVSKEYSTIEYYKNFLYSIDCKNIM